MFIALALALVALGVAIGAWFRPTTTESAAPVEPQYSEQEVADAKEALCEAYEKTLKAVQVAGAQTSADPGEMYGVIVNTRLAAEAAATYLLETLNANPATSSELVSPIKDLIKGYREAVLKQLAVAPSDQLEPIYADIQSAEKSIQEICR